MVLPWETLINAAFRTYWYKAKELEPQFVNLSYCWHLEPTSPVAAKYAAASDVLFMCQQFNC